jgi:HK97 family phage major capsid protein
MSQVLIEESTVKAIEKGIEDIKANKATKSEVISLIDERVKSDKEKIDSLQTELQTAKSRTEELVAASKELKDRMTSIMQSRSGLFDGSGNWKGPFRSMQEAKAFGAMVMAAACANTKHQAKADMAIKCLNKMGIDPYWLDGLGHKTMTGASQAGGGALVLAEQIPGWIMLLETYGVLQSEAQIVPMGSGEGYLPKISGLLTDYTPGEGQEITVDDPDIGLINLICRTSSFLTGYSLELEEDSMVALGVMLGDLFARSVAYAIDKYGILGDGTATYKGVKGICGALLKVDSTIGNIKGLTVGTGNAYSELVIGDFEKVPGTLPDYAAAEAKWLMHRYFYYTVIVKLALASGAANATEILLGTGLKQKNFLGDPVKFCQVMPKAEANSQICTLYGNIRMGCMLGMRGGLQIAQSTERYFEKGIVAVRARQRWGINAHGVGDTTDAGPIVGLITAAT